MRSVLESRSKSSPLCTLVDTALRIGAVSVGVGTLGKPSCNSSFLGCDHGLTFPFNRFGFEAVVSAPYVFRVVYFAKFGSTVRSGEGFAG